MPWFKIFRALLIVSVWAKGALKDGKVSIYEGFELAGKLADLLGLPTEFTAPFFREFLDELKDDNLINMEDIKR